MSSLTGSIFASSVAVESYRHGQPPSLLIYETGMVKKIKEDGSVGRDELGGLS